MSIFSRNKIALIIPIVGIVALGVFYAVKTKGTKPNPTVVNPAFGEYIAAYTAGVVESGSVIRIALARNAVDSLKVGLETSDRLFTFDPELGGKTVWVDQRTVEFRPDTRLISGQHYIAKFALSKLLQVPTELSYFEYTFQVIPQNFEVAINNVKPYVKSVLNRQKIEGEFYTADFASPEDIKNVMIANQEGKALAVTWDHDATGKRHLFVVEDVVRKEGASLVKVKLDGGVLGINREEDLEVEIPALADFKMTAVKVEHTPAQHVVIQFSDPLNDKQMLDGLVSLSDVGSLDFEIRDNEILVYPSTRQTGSKKLVIEHGIRNILDHRLTERSEVEVIFEQLNPQVRFTGKGSVLPGSDGLIMPFEAVNLKSVDVEILKIYEQNVVQFLQVNDLNGNSELRRVGKPILRKTVTLENTGITDLGKWNRFTLDLSTLIATEPGAIYQVRIGFRRSSLAYYCEDGNSINNADDMTSFESGSWDESDYGEASNWDSYEDYYYDEDYDWRERDNPCHSSYYAGNRTIRKNVVASDLGILAKRGTDGKTIIFVNDLKTTKPIAGVVVDLYDYQQRHIGTGTTDAVGKSVIESDQTPFVLIGRNGAQRGYLKLGGGESLSVSNFDVSGELVKKGLKGFLYGERGVWRPGDSLHLVFILEDKLKTLPQTHPVVFELYNPQGQVVNRIVRSSGIDGFYDFATATAEDAPTGNWKGVVKVGGAEFTRALKVETVKPNRLKIGLDFGVEKLSARNSSVTGDLQINWLHGAPGRNLKATFEVLLTRAETTFKQFPNFVFDDPSRVFNSEAKTIFEGYTDSEGHALVSAALETADAAPGMLNAVFRGKAFEESGNFSIDRFSIPYYPYVSFTGIRLPPGDHARGMLLTDTTHHIDIVTVDDEGTPVSRDNIEMSVYKLEWRWWWNSDAGDASYMATAYSQPVLKGNTTTKNGRGTWDFRINYPEWGRYYVRAYDPVSGHSSGKVVYIDWPGWAGRSRGGNQGATMLSFSADKTNYAIGEEAILTIPGSDQGRALVSLENGSGVMDTYWVETKEGDTPFRFRITEAMTPTVYVNITLVQPHAQTSNDLPMRMYGIIPINVEDPKTRLKPLITMPDVLEPGKEVIIKVSEESRRNMTYTLAVVDEGLLDLTRFATPDPWSRFYAREALGVKTWDIYDDVMGAFGSRIERLLAIGGDMESSQGKEDDVKANRFKPVVKFLGPFTSKGAGNEHRFIMPEYIGSVRTMVVAGREGAYGSTSKATPVRKPLMVLATLPRVLGPEEKVTLPVTLFSMEKSISNVTVTVKVSGPLQIDQPSQSVSMREADATIDFDLTVGSSLGVGTIEVTATSGSYRASDVIEFDVRNPNPPITNIDEMLLEPGKNWKQTILPVGMSGTNTATLEVSSMPPVNLGQRMKNLLQYPYGCLEQTTSSVFPQLYLSQLKSLTGGEAEMIQTNIKAGIERLKLFMTRDGGFAYWPGGEDSESWSSTYAGNFLVEAEARGYVVPRDLLNRWKKYQRNRAQSWRRQEISQSGELIQAYRLYSLAQAGVPEMGAMNRLREQENVPTTALWMLAAAYATAGQPEAASKLIEDLPTSVNPYREQAYSFGSELRDKAIILETLLTLKNNTLAFEIAKEISEALSNPSYWMSTQTTAWCLKAMSAFAAAHKQGDLAFNYTYNGKTVNAKTDLPIAQFELPIDGMANRSLEVVSQSTATLFARIVSVGTSARGTEKEDERNLKMSVSYTNVQGAPIDPSRLEQGTEFLATVSIANPGLRGAYKNLALSQIFPSGWEINNLRLDDAEDRLKFDIPTYQDIRDDRVYTYFDLAPNQKKTFKVLLTASYAGTFYLPAQQCEAMYDHGVFASKHGVVVHVVKGQRQ